MRIEINFITFDKNLFEMDSVDNNHSTIQNEFRL
jgi:hypothetical protein